MSSLKLQTEKEFPTLKEPLVLVSFNKKIINIINFHPGSCKGGRIESTPDSTPHEV